MTGMGLCNQLEEEESKILNCWDNTLYGSGWFSVSALYSESESTQLEGCYGTSQDPQGTMLTPSVIPLHYSSKKIIANMSPPPLSVSLEPYLPQIPGPHCKWRLNLTPLAAELEFRFRSEATASIFGIPRPVTKLFIYKGWFERLRNYLKYEDGLNLCSSNSIYLIDPAEADGT